MTATKVGSESSVGIIFTALKRGCNVFLEQDNTIFSCLDSRVPSAKMANVSTVFSKRETATRPLRSGVKEKCLGERFSRYQIFVDKMLNLFLISTSATFQK